MKISNFSLVMGVVISIFLLGYLLVPQGDSQHQQSALISEETHAQTSGTIYYVSPAGSDTNPGTLSQPWKTITKAANTLVAGQTVLVRGGTYVEQVRPINSGTLRKAVTTVTLSNGNTATFSTALTNVNSGDYLYIYHSRESNNGAFVITAVNGNSVTVEGQPFLNESTSVTGAIVTPIIYKAYSGETVTIDGNYQKLQGFYLNGKSFLIIDGFTIRRAAGNGLYITQEEQQPSTPGSSYNVIRNNKISESNRTGMIIYGLGSVYNMIDSNEIFGNGINGPGEGVYVGVDKAGWGTTTGGQPNTNHHTHIINNYFHDGGTAENAIDLKQNLKYTVIESNRIERISTGHWNGAIMIDEDNSDVLMYNNTISSTLAADTNPGGAIVLYGLLSTSSAGQYEIFNNVIDSSADAGILLFNNPTGIQIWNNTIVNTKNGIRLDGVSAQPVIKNNIFSQNTSHVVGTASTASNNLFFAPTTTIGTNAITGDPLFVNASSQNFHLQAGSPAIDAGTSVNIIIDRDLLSRPQGAAIDVGAYEHVAVSVTPTATLTPPLASPTPTRTPTPTIVVPTSTSTPIPTATPTLKPTYKSTVLSDGPIAYWRLGETSGTSAVDEKASYSGTYINSPVLGQTGALVNDTNKAVLFNASNVPYVSVPYNASLNPQAFSVEVWAYPTGGTGTYRGVVSSRKIPKGWVLYANNSNLWSFWFNNGSTDMLKVNGPAVTLNTWTHIVVSFDGSTARMYINGVLKASATRTLTYTPNNQNPLTIGQGAPGEGFPFKGKIDEVSFYNKMLTASQIQSHYTAGK